MANGVRDTGLWGKGCVPGGGICFLRNKKCNCNLFPTYHVSTSQPSTDKKLNFTVSKNTTATLSTINTLTLTRDHSGVSVIHTGKCTHGLVVHTFNLTDLAHVNNYLILSAGGPTYIRGFR